MKKLLCLLFVFSVSSFYVQASTEEERYWDYVVSELQSLQQNGGVFSGALFEIDQDKPEIGFAEYFNGGIARASLNCTPGWYQGYASWENMDREQIFCSQYMSRTYLGVGLQFIPFQMEVNYSRSIKLVINGELTTDSDEIWFNGVRAWRDSGNTWRAWAYKPWNLIDQSVEVVWIGHGSWNVQMNSSSFGQSISLNTADINTTVVTPTQVQAVSFLSDGAYLNEELVSYSGRYYDPVMGCEVLEFESLFSSNIQELTVVLSGYEQYLGGTVNYFTATLKSVSPGLFILPLGDIYIRPYTDIKVFLTDPNTGEYKWKYLDSKDLWYEVLNGGDKG